MAGYFPAIDWPALNQCPASRGVNRNGSASGVKRAVARDIQNQKKEFFTGEESPGEPGNLCAVV